MSYASAQEGKKKKKNNTNENGNKRSFHIIGKDPHNDNQQEHTAVQLPMKHNPSLH
jgi:hypothetical protein